MNVKMDKKSLVTLALLLGVVVIIIVAINYAGGDGLINGNSTVNVTNSSENLTNEEVIMCVGEKSKLVVSPTCGYCARQKQELSEYYEGYTEYLEVIDVSEHPEVIEEYGISGVPSWVISGGVDSGYKHISEIRELTGC